jgi:hypothetical protein
MCLEKAAAQSDDALRAGWLAAAEHLFALAGECAKTLTLGPAVSRVADVGEREAQSAWPEGGAVKEAAISS